MEGVDIIEEAELCCGALDPPEAISPEGELKQPLENDAKTHKIKALELTCFTDGPLFPKISLKDP